MLRQPEQRDHGDDVRGRGHVRRSKPRHAHDGDGARGVHVCVRDRVHVRRSKFHRVHGGGAHVYVRS